MHFEKRPVPVNCIPFMKRTTRILQNRYQPLLPRTPKIIHKKDLKLPTTVSGGYSSNQSSHSFTFGKRTQSYSNLSSYKYSDSSRGSNNNHNTTVPNMNLLPLKTNLHKVRSDQNIYYKCTTPDVKKDYKSNSPLVCANSRSLMASQPGRKTRYSNTSVQNHQKPLRNSQSQPIIQSLSGANIRTDSKPQKKKYSENDGRISQNLVKYNPNDIFGEANEKDKRIINWLMGIWKRSWTPWDTGNRRWWTPTNRHSYSCCIWGGLVNLFRSVLCIGMPILITIDCSNMNIL